MGRDGLPALRPRRCRTSLRSGRPRPRFGTRPPLRDRAVPPLRAHLYQSTPHARDHRSLLPQRLSSPRPARPARDPTSLPILEPIVGPPLSRSAVDGSPGAARAGCSTSDAAAAAICAAWRNWAGSVSGLDVSPLVAQSIRDELGLEIHLGTLPHPDLSPGSFDVVTMWQSLEHVHEPLAVLRRLTSCSALAEESWSRCRITKVSPRNGSASTGSVSICRAISPTSRAGHSSRCCGPRAFASRRFAASCTTTGSRPAPAPSQARAAGPCLRLLTHKRLARIAAWANYALGQPDSLVAVAERPA